MENNNQNKKQQLYRSLGDIRDYYVADAEAFVIAKRLQRQRRATVISVIAAALVFILIVTVVSAKLSSDNQTSEGQGKDTDYASGVYTEGPVTGFEETDPIVAKSSFFSESDCAAYETASIDFYDGSVKLIWTYTGSDKLYSITVSDKVAASVKIKQTGAKRLAYGEETTDLRLWICHEDGTVDTPFLSDDSGNLEYGKIFDYEPEFDITASTADFLDGLLT